MRSWFRARSNADRRYRPVVEALEHRLTPTLGVEFPINTSANDTERVAVASSANGTSVAVWDQQVGMDNRDIFARRFDAANNPVGPVIVLPSTPENEINPDVAMDANGNFVVIWTQPNAQLLPFARYVVFDSTGNELTNGFMVGSVGVEVPRVAMNAAGVWVVVFTAPAFNGDDIFARRFDLNGTALGDIVVSANPLVSESNPRIDANASGRFSIAYTFDTFGLDDLYVKRYSKSGKLLGKHKIAGGAASYDVALDNKGNTTVVYGNPSGSLEGIFSRQVTSTGVRKPPKMVTSASPTSNPAVAMDRITGRFVVAYQSGSGVVTIRELTRKGGLLAEHFLINRSFPAVSVDGDSTYFVAGILEQSASNDDVWGVFGEL